MPRMEQAVVFLGGTNGAGKSYLTEQLAERDDYAVTKQKRELTAVGEERGIPYEEIPKRYDELIAPAAERAVEEFAAADARVLLFDCHYAFQKEKAVTMNLEGEIPDIDEAYQQAVDDRVISRFLDRFPTGFVFLSVDPAVAHRRMKRRAKNVEDEEVTLEEVKERQEAERIHYDGITEKFDVDADRHTVIDNSREGDAAGVELERFVDSKLRSRR